MDVLVSFSRPVGFIAFMRLERRLELLGRKVDLVTRNAFDRISETDSFRGQVCLTGARFRTISSTSFRQ